MPRTATARVLRAGLCLAIVDGLWAIALTMSNGRPPMSVWQGVASTAFGPGMLTGGTPAILIGLAMHVGVALTWSALFVALEARWAFLRRAVASPLGALGVAVVYGPLIWVVMSAVVVPALTGRAVTLSVRWFIQLAGHAVFVGPPIVWGARR